MTKGSADRRARRVRQEAEAQISKMRSALDSADRLAVELTRQVRAWQKVARLAEQTTDEVARILHARIVEERARFERIRGDYRRDVGREWRDEAPDRITGHPAVGRARKR